MSAGLAATRPGGTLVAVVAAGAWRAMPLERGPPTEANPDMLPSLAAVHPTI